MRKMTFLEQMQNYTPEHKANFKTRNEMTDTPKVCKHGSLRRVCETCDLAEDVVRLERELAEARAKLDHIVSTYDAYRRRGVSPAPKEYADVVAAIDAARREHG